MRLNYRDLGRRSGALAEKLRMRFEKPGLIAIHMAPGVERVIAVLGVLRAGHGYLPLDPQYPADRLHAMMTSAAPAAVIGDRPDAPTPAQSQWLAARDWLAEAGDDSAPWGTELPTAYVIFTSGSTGKPKGIDMPGDVLDRLLAWQFARSACGTGDATLQFSPLSFDVSFQEIFATLGTCGTLVVADERRRRDPMQLIQLLERHRVRRLFLPFVALDALAQTAHATGRYPDSLTEIVTAGEQLKITPALRAVAAATGFTLDNQYGPAETHVVTAHRLDGPPEQWPELPPIGRPLPHATVRVADEQGDPVAAGEAGELWIGGGAPARGYFHDDDATRSAFVTRDGDRWYRTGDEVLADESGSLRWLSRLDSQIKIAGVRVEPGEVEAALGAHPDVERAVVTAVESGGTRRLAAYFVIRADRAAGERDRHIAEWEQVWDQTYRETEPEDPVTHAVGWRSSFDGEAYSLNVMAQWANDICAQIRERPHARVAEIGAGTGMIALRLAPHTERYFATDVSAAAIDYLAGVAENDPAMAALRCRAAPAHEAVAAIETPVDAIVINSVTQHLPDAQYLQDLLAACRDRLAPGGQIFVGDVFHRDLAPRYFRRVAEASMPGAGEEAIAAEAARREALDQELRISPTWFVDVAESIGGLAVYPLLERGDGGSEMAEFRYHAVFVSGGAEDGGQTLTPKPAPSTLAELERSLRQLTTAGRWAGLPNARLVNHGGIDPQRCLALADHLDVRVRLEPNLQDPLAFDVVAWPSDGPEPRGPTASPPDPTTRSQWTTHPALRAIGEALEPEIRAYLSDRLVPAAVPNYLIALPALPLTPSGKLDRRRLPAPVRRRPPLGTAPAPARTETEKRLATLWLRLLALEEVGIDDPFFDVGGNSLLLTRLFVAIRAEFAEAGRDFEPYELLESPTIRLFSSRLDRILDREAGESKARAAGARQRAAFAANKR